MLCEPPPRDWNPGAYGADADSTAGRAATPFFPATPPEARHMTAPAGSILMYHSGTWHRISANLSPSPRIGIAQSFVPDFIVESTCPGGPRQPNGGRLCSAERIALRGYLAAKQPEDSAEHSRFRGCAEAALLTPREADDLERLWVGTERCERAMLCGLCFAPPVSLRRHCCCQTTSRWRRARGGWESSPLQKMQARTCPGLMRACDHPLSVCVGACLMNV